MSEQLRAQNLRQYLLITANYWAFTLTDGALRMLVVLHFYSLGYTPLEIALLFLFYEFFGVVTNLYGGWLGSRIGLNRTMHIGLALQLIALAMLLVPDEWLSVAWVMIAQAISGIAKDLNKMSAKTSIKFLMPEDESNRLFRWVALLTGSKNTLKGVGYFIGGALLVWLDFQGAVAIMLAGLLLVWLCSLLLLKTEFGKTQYKTKLSSIWSNSSAINSLASARLFLFASRDAWFVVALPVYFSSALAWSHSQVGAFMAIWIIFYGLVQAFTPRIIGKHHTAAPMKIALFWVLALLVVTLSLTLNHQQGFYNEATLVLGLLGFAVVFAVNSSLHSFFIVRFADKNSAATDVGFYYMANAAGRLAGTILSGWVYQQYNQYGLLACLFTACALQMAAAVLTLRLPSKLND